MKRFFKLFWVTGLGFACLYGLAMYVFVWSRYRYPLSYCLFSSVLSGAFFGFIMAVLIRLAEIFAFGKLGVPHSQIGVRQEQLIRLPQSRTETRKMIGEILKDLKAKVVYENNEFGSIVAQTGISLRTSAQTLTIKLTEVPGLTEVWIESRPSVPWCLVDYGKNLENTQFFKRRLDAQEDPG